MTFGFLITLCAAMQVGGCVSSPGPQTPENELEQAMVRLFEFHVPGMCNITPTVRVDYGGRATGAPYLFPRTGRVWTSGNGAVEIWAECFALRDDTATRRYLKEHVGSDAPIDHTPSRAAIGDAVRAGQTYGYVDVAYGRFVVNVSRLYRNLDQADGATPALVPDMVESVARAVAYSLLRAGLVKDGRTGAAAAGERPQRLP